MRVLKTLLFLSLISALILPSFKILAEDSASTLSVENEVSIESAANSDETNLWTHSRKGKPWKRN